MRSVIRPWPPQSTKPPSVTVCVNVREGTHPSCGRRGSPEMLRALEEGLLARGLNFQVLTIKCLGPCAKGPNIRVAPSGSFYMAVTVGDVPALIDSLEREMKSAG